MKRFLSPLAFFMLCICTNVSADTGVIYNLQVTGTIISESCEVDTASQEQSVELGDFDASDFCTVGSTTSPTPFTIKLKNCAKTINGTMVWFSGLAVKDNPALLALSNTGKGTEGMLATGIGVEILDNTLKSIPINNAESDTFPLVEGDNTLAFNLRYKSTQQNVTPGDATAVMYFDLLYQ